MITELPQSINLEAIKNEWLKIGLSTEPDDEENANKGIDLAYEAANLKPPKIRIWLNSPLEGCIAAHLITNKGKINNSKGLNLEEFNNEINTATYGQHDVGWLAFYWVFKDMIPELSLLNGLWLLAKSTGWIWLYKDLVLFTRRPIKISINKNNQLHCDNGPAVLYRDNFALYRLNGVNVPEWLVNTPAELINPNEFTKITNAEIRREFVRKIGMERIIYKLQPKILDERGDYSLIVVKLDDGRVRPFLKMRNPSIDTWHVEGVPPGITTVQEALNWRNSLDNSQIDDINGVDTYQQGDVIIRPSGANKFKSSPKTLS